MLALLSNLFVNHQYLAIVISYLIGYKISRLAGSEKHVFKQAFQRSDPNIAKPFLAPTFTPFFMHVASLGPAVIMYFFEHLYPARETSNSVLNYAFGLMIMQATYNFAKFTCGRLRPHFLDVNGVEFDASDHKFYTEVTKDISKGPRIEKQVIDSRCSFFSGHSMAGGFAAASLVIFVQKKVPNPSNLFVRALQCAIFTAGFFPAATQYRQNWHHSDDCLIGHLLGTLDAYFVFYYCL